MSELAEYGSLGTIVHGSFMCSAWYVCSELDKLSTVSQKATVLCFHKHARVLLYSLDNATNIVCR
jgi:hypothetical protein